MQVKAEQLQAHLSKGLAPVYAIHGDEPLLALEAADAVRAAARGRGFSQREVFEPGRHFDWSEFAHAAGSQSLFGDKKVIELRLASGKPAVPVAKALTQYCARPNADAVLLVTMPRPEGAGWWKSEWFASLDAATAGHRVGYESPSQFSREYSRLFGAPPATDRKRLAPQREVI